MGIARSLERRLERILVGAAGRLFTGRVHPSELAGRIAREADLARYHHATGPATANRYLLRVSPEDLDGDPSQLGAEAAAALAEHAARSGLRLEGPPEVVIETDPGQTPGRLHCRAEVSPAPLAPWARLVGPDGQIGIGHNRVLVGRGADADVALPHEEVSRRHALIWREGGRVLVEDLGSANGTTVDGRRAVGPTPLAHGSRVGFGGHEYRLLET